MSEASSSELFFGFVSPIGIGCGTLAKSLNDALREASYQAQEIRLIGELESLERHVPSENGFKLDNDFSLGNYKSEYDRYDQCITAANKFGQIFGEHHCRKLEQSGSLPQRDHIEEHGQKSLARLAVNCLFKLRSQDKINNAYILRSLKRPGELQYLRKIYGGAFFAISAQAPIGLRTERLAEKLASSGRLSLRAAKAQAATLSSRDQDESDKICGQRVRDAFVMADYYVDASGTIDSIDHQMKRLVRLLFGHPFETPTRDEYGMAMAYVASFRSAHWSRQVGAVITTSDGSIVATGTNEVPKAFGGAYWHEDKPDRRDYQLKANASFEARQGILGDLLDRINGLGWFRDEIAEEVKSGEKFVEDAAREHLRDALLMDALEYDRSIHAEMLAITDAARRGVPLQDCTLYSTTFPCHNCARHIIAAGIRRVVFLYPYDKSLAERLHGDSLGVDLSASTGKELVRFDPYVGIAPNHYTTMFALPERKGQGKYWKRAAEWPLLKPKPRLWENQERITAQERLEAESFSKDLLALGFVQKKPLERSDPDERNGEGSRGERKERTV